MGLDSELELVLEHATDLPTALSMVSDALASGKIGNVEAQRLAAQANSLHNPSLQGPSTAPRAIPVPKVWAPDVGVSAKVKGDDLERVRICPDTGRAIFLTDEAREAATAAPSAEGDSQRSSTDRFPCGKAIVLGRLADGTFCLERFVVGFSCKNPYSAAACAAAAIVKSGGEAMYAHRLGGFTVTIEKTRRGRYDSCVLTASAAVDGVRGYKGLTLVNARTNYEVPLAERLLWHHVAETIETEGELSTEQWKDALSDFWPPIRSTKAELTAAFDAAKARACMGTESGEAMPFHDRPTHVEALAVPCRMFDENGVETRRSVVDSDDALVRSNAMAAWRFRANSGTARDSSQPADTTGMIAFVLHFDGGIARTQYEKVPEKYVRDEDTGEAVWPPTTLASALALQTAGPMCVHRVTWNDTLGEHVATRADALIALPEEEEEVFFKPFNWEQHQHDVAMVLAGETLDAIDPRTIEGLDLDGISIIQTEPSDWMVEHQSAVRHRSAADSCDDSKEAKKHERLAEKHERAAVKITRREVGAYKRPGAIERSMSKGYKAHKNYQNCTVRPKSNGRAINAKNNN